MPRPNDRWEPLAASDIKAVGILEDVRIPVGRTEKQDDVVAFAQCKPVHLAIGEHAPEIRLYRRVETQQLLDRRRDQARVVPQPLKLFGMTKQSQHAVAETAHRDVHDRYRKGGWKRLGIKSLTVSIRRPCSRNFRQNSPMLGI